MTSLPFSMQHVLLLLALATLTTGNRVFHTTSTTPRRRAPDEVLPGRRNTGGFSEVTQGQGGESIYMGGFNLIASDGSSQTFYFDLDTGSANMGVAMAGIKFTNSLNQLLDPQPLGFNVTGYSPGKVQKVQYGNSKATASYMEGPVYKIPVAIANSSFLSSSIVMTSQSDFLTVNNKVVNDGIIGLAYQSLAVGFYPPFFKSMWKQFGGGIDQDMFSMQFCGTAPQLYPGNIWFGGYSPSYFANPNVELIWTPIQQAEEQFYYIKFTAFSVGSTSLSVTGEPFPIIDSGTTLVYLNSPLFDQLKTALIPYLSPLTSTLVNQFFTGHYYLPNYFINRLPTISMTFSGGLVLSLPPKVYLSSESSGYRINIYASPNSGQSIIGLMALLNQIVIFDMGRYLLTITPTHLLSCGVPDTNSTFNSSSIPVIPTVQDLCGFTLDEIPVCALTCQECDSLGGTGFCQSGSAYATYRGQRIPLTANSFCWSANPFQLTSTTQVFYLGVYGQFTVTVSCDGPPQYNQCGISGGAMIAIMTIITIILIALVVAIIYTLTCSKRNRREQRRQVSAMSAPLLANAANYGNEESLPPRPPSFYSVDEVSSFAELSSDVRLQPLASPAAGRKA